MEWASKPACDQASRWHSRDAAAQWRHQGRPALGLFTHEGSTVALSNALTHRAVHRRDVALAARASPRKTGPRK